MLGHNFTNCIPLSRRSQTRNSTLANALNGIKLELLSEIPPDGVSVGRVVGRFADVID